MIAWSIKLLEYDITYELRGTIRAQVLADFINEFHPPPLHFEQEWWTMRVGDFSNKHNSRVGVILEVPSDVAMA